MFARCITFTLYRRFQAKELSVFKHKKKKLKRKALHQSKEFIEVLQKNFTFF